MGKLLSLDGGRKFKVKSITWLKKISHWFTHSWSKWDDGVVINIYFNSNKDVPNRRELRQERKCEVCNIKQTRRVDY